MKTKLLLLVLALALVTCTVHAQWVKDAVDANNINATVEADGTLFEQSAINVGFEMPKFSGKHLMYISTLWMGGLDQGGQLHLAAQTYKQTGTDYWPAPLDVNGNVLPTSTWNKIWKVNRSVIDNHIANYGTNGYIVPAEISDWPGSVYNGVSQVFAPYIDANNNGMYDPAFGDYPNVNGDQALYMMYNDKNTVHGESGALPIGAEIYTTVYSFNSTGSTIIDNTVFVRHRIRNKSQNTYNSFYAGIWNDVEIGMYSDDFIGSDVPRNMIYGYNSDSTDGTGSGNSYGLNPPSIGIKVLNQSLSSAMYYTNDGSVNGNPQTETHFYNYLRAKFKDGTPLSFGGNGYQTGAANTNFCFSGGTDPAFTGNWTTPTNADYRILANVGPFTIAPNGFITIDVAYIAARDNSGNSLPQLGIAADVVQNFYNSALTEIPENTIALQAAIFPNPAKEQLTIIVNNCSNPSTQLRVFGITGALQLQKQMHSQQQIYLPINELSPGVYFIEIKNGEQIKHLRFIKE